ncbi:MAG: homoserine O-succinyltransferase [Coriobacteriia bacterium]|nr:homoserine O-succinyltransferase [Coriobacteriia bacterium]
MPVKIKDGLPAVDVLAKENVFVMTDKRASKQDIRPLKIVVLNLMPTKETTETQILRVLGNSPLQVEVTFLHTATYKPTHSDPMHLHVFYNTFDNIKEQKFDGLIITGAPVEHLAFNEVEYWDELVEIMNWADENVYSTLHICWAAQAGLYHYYGIDKRTLSEKVFGIFSHTVTDDKNKLTRGFDDTFNAPHSRHTTVLYQDIIDCAEIELLAYSDEAGAFLMASKDGRRVFVTGHSEYDADTLKLEYERDKAAGLDIETPHNYFPDDDPQREPKMTWRAHASLLFSNWVNYCVYQETPYDLDELATREKIKAASNA